MSDENPAPSPRPPTPGALPVPTPSSAREPLRPIPTRTIALISAGILVLTVGAVLLLWWPGTAGLSGQALVTARFDALRTGLNIGIGSGGIFALYLAWRRQHATEVGLIQKERDQADVARAYELQREIAEHTRLVAENTRLHAERVAKATEKDAADRRVTELTTKGSEQLGSDKAPVRLAGLYALERLAQHNEDQRSTVISVLCAYLRMPFEIPLTTGELDQLDPDSDTSKRAYERNRVLVEEREVRLTAQQILTSHLPAADGSNTASWGEYGLDLSGAVLFDLDLSGRCLHDVVFHSTRFVGVTRFDEAIFAGVAKFGRARFDGLAFLKRTTFRLDVSFYNARFIVGARLAGATFEAEANFTDVVFGNNPGLNEAIYKGRKPVLHGVTVTEHGKNGEFYMRVEPSFPAGWEVVAEKLEDDGRRLLQTLGRQRRPTEKDSGPTSESDAPQTDEDPPAPSAPA